MRIKSMGLSWFRGAADPVSLDPDCKSMVVYGVNGSGKSSFVDAVEYVLNDGKIRHLAHEYSGKHQEKAVPNTHVPEDRKPELSIKFADDSELKIEIQQDGSWTSSGGEAAAVGAWDYRRTVLRQDEVAAFIRDTKGGKYSALLPLLGLHPLEVAAENLRQLAKSVEKEAKLGETKNRLSQVEATRKTTFGTDSHAQIIVRIEELHAKYCADKAATTDPLSRCKELKTALDARIAVSSADQRRHVALQDAAALDLKGYVDAVRAASAKLAGAAEPLIAEKLGVLQSAGAFVDKLADEEEVKCPACGQSIPVDAFEAHVKAEQDRLQEIGDTFNEWKAAIGTLCDTVKLLKSNLGKADAKPWRDDLAKGPLADNFAHLDGMAPEALRTLCGEDDLKAIEGKLLPLIDAAAAASKDRPLFLDDVVVSLDRNHRGMIVELLEKEFSARQVVILTHDREWYTELRQQLDGEVWGFKALLPYETPAIGIRWSHKTTTFGDARAHLKDRPDSAGNDARKIMDVDLALIAERLQIRLPYLRADKNDKRMAHDFLERFVADGKKCFQKKAGEAYEGHTDAIDAFEHADRLLTSWANRASHAFDLVRQEATKLIDICEKALECLKCSSCGKGVWFANAEGSEWVQCQCGQIRWRYGKG